MKWCGYCNHTGCRRDKTWHLSTWHPELEFLACQNQTINNTHQYRPAISKMSQHLLEWAKHNKSHLHSSVEIYQDDVTGLSFRATHDIGAATSLVECSYETTLSYLNAIQASPIFSRHGAIPFPADFLNTLSRDDPNIIGYFFLIQQHVLPFPFILSKE